MKFCDFKSISSVREGNYKWYDPWYGKEHAKFWPCFLQYSSPRRFLTSNLLLRRMAYHVHRWLLWHPDCYWSVPWIVLMILQHDPNAYACKAHERPDNEENCSSRRREQLSDLQDQPTPIVPWPCPEPHTNSYLQRAERQRLDMTSWVLA